MGLLAKPTAGDEALVLRVWPSGETSCVVSLLTSRHGFIKVIAKAARRPRSQLRPLTEPGRLVTVEFGLDPARELQYLRGGTVLLDPLATDATLERSAFLLGALELVDRCRPGGNEASEAAVGDLFAICEDYVRVLSSASCVAPDLLFFALEWLLLAGQGLAPELATCTVCGLACSGERSSTLWFNPAEGGVVCGACAAAGTASGGRPLSLVALYGLREIATRGLAVDVEAPLARDLRRELGALLHRFLGYHLPGYRLPAALDLLRPASERASAEE